MIHQDAADGPDSHWAVGHNCNHEFVLVQVQNRYGDQARVPLTVPQARDMIRRLELAITTVCSPGNTRPL